jgi:hypothetical protein
MFMIETDGKKVGGNDVEGSIEEPASIVMTNVRRGYNGKRRRKDMINIDDGGKGRSGICLPIQLE